MGSKHLWVPACAGESIDPHPHTLIPGPGILPMGETPLYIGHFDRGFKACTPSYEAALQPCTMSASLEASRQWGLGKISEFRGHGAAAPLFSL